MKFLPKPKAPVSMDAGISQGTEIVGSVVVFLGIGFGIDKWLGTTPVFMICLVLFAVVAQFVKMYYVYNSAMRHLEEKRAKDGRGVQS
ncbi:MAG: hypothetical protein F2595_00245 [Actinobacteria bacterium]|nr:hypothetical protein [Actinomycetota bacterium]